MRFTLFYRLTGLTYATFLTLIITILAIGGLTDWEQVARQGVARNRDWRPQVQVFESGLAMVLVPAGCFAMGDVGDPSIGGGGWQCLAALFWISRTEITNAQYGQCVEAGVCSPPQLFTGFIAPDQPVIGVDWFQAWDFAAWVGGRLPTEAEWEYAARGPDGWTYPWGEESPTCARINFYDHEFCVGMTSPVGHYSPQGDSWVGASDMAGNVWEWTGTIYRHYPYRVADVGEAGAHRVARGGSWLFSPQVARAAYRFLVLPSHRTNRGGFRVVQDHSPQR